MNNWNVSISNQSLLTLYTSFLSNFDNILKFHIISNVASDICVQIKDHVDRNIEFKLSNKFPDGFSTIRTYGEGIDLIENGCYTELN